MKVEKYTIFARVANKNSKQNVMEITGYAVQYNGVALHLRKLDNLWIISLLNSGFLTRGSGKTIKAALLSYLDNDGKIIEDWKFERGAKHLYMLEKLYFKENIQIPIKYELTKEGHIVKCTQVKAGDLI